MVSPLLHLHLQPLDAKALFSQYIQSTQLDYGSSLMDPSKLDNHDQPPAAQPPIYQPYNAPIMPGNYHSHLYRPSPIYPSFTNNWQEPLLRERLSFVPPPPPSHALQSTLSQELTFRPDASGSSAAVHFGTASAPTSYLPPAVPPRIARTRVATSGTNKSPSYSHNASDATNEEKRLKNAQSSQRHRDKRKKIQQEKDARIEYLQARVRDLEKALTSGGSGLSSDRELQESLIQRLQAENSKLRSQLESKMEYGTSSSGTDQASPDSNLSASPTYASSSSHTFPSFPSLSTASFPSYLSAEHSRPSTANQSTSPPLHHVYESTDIGGKEEGSPAGNSDRESCGGDALDFD